MMASDTMVSCGRCSSLASAHHHLSSLNNSQPLQTSAARTSHELLEEVPNLLTTSATTICNMYFPAQDLLHTFSPLSHFCIHIILNKSVYT